MKSMENVKYRLNLQRRKTVWLLQCTKDYNKNGLPTYNFYRSSKERYFIFLKCNDYMLQLRAKLARRLIS